MADIKKDNSKKQRSWVKWLIVPVVLVLAGTAVFFVTNRRGKMPEMSERTAEVTTMTIENTLESDGEIESSLEENVLPHTSYYLSKINVEEGEAVEKGDVILTYTNGYTMKAPYNCVVKSWSLPDEEEQLTSDHYVTLAGTDVLQMEIELSDSEVLDLSVGDSAKVKVEALDKEYEAEVTYVSEAGEYSSGSSTFTAKVSFDNDGSIKLGMSGTATVTLEKAEDVLAVPEGAVSTKGGVSYVTVKSDSGTSQVEVETGITNGSYTEIKSGLSEGDQVVVQVSEDSSEDDKKGMMGGGPGDFGGTPPDGGGGSRMGGGPGGK